MSKTFSINEYQKQRLNRLVKGRQDLSLITIISIIQLSSTMFQLWYKDRSSQIVIIDKYGKLSLPRTKCVYDPNFNINQISN